MNSDKNKYLRVDCRDMYTIDYALVEVNVGLVPYTGDNCDKLFKKMEYHLICEKYL